MATSPIKNATSIAYEASRIIKTAPAILYGFSGYNSKSSTQFILVFDANSIPAEGAIPMIIISVAASSSFAFDLGSVGRTMKYGIVLVNSSTGPTKTIGSADCWFDVQYS